MVAENGSGKGRGGKGIGGIIALAAIWFGYMYFMAVPSEYGEMEQTVRAECLANGRDNQFCTCVSSQTIIHVREDRLEWALRRGTFVTYTSELDVRVPEYIEEAIQACRA